MFDRDISKMNFKQLREEVQLLRDELAVFKRKYEDAIYNLDSDNFGKSFTVEQNNMKAQIKISADAIKTMVSSDDLSGELEKYSTITQTAEQIETAVKKTALETDNKLKEYSTVSQTADAITSTVTGEYVKSLINDEYVTNAVFNTEIKQTTDEIIQTVSLKYQTKDDADDSYSLIRSEISQKASQIGLRVESLEELKESVFLQTADGFLLDGEQTAFTGVIYLTDNNKEKSFSVFHDESQGYEQVLMHSCSNNPSLPIIIGDYVAGEHYVYIGAGTEKNKVATRGWVEEAAEVTAVFG